MICTPFLTEAGDQSPEQLSPLCTTFMCDKNANKWKVGPDRYYATFGIQDHSRDGWNEARKECEHKDAQLAIPYSQDDAHFMKHMEHVMESQTWVGKLFVPPSDSSEEG